MNDPIKATHKVMNDLAKHIDKVLKSRIDEKGSNNWGFALIIFNFDHPGIGNYVSNASRKDMIKALQNAAERIKNSQDMPPTHPTMQ